MYVISKNQEGFKNDHRYSGGDRRLSGRLTVSVAKEFIVIRATARFVSRLSGVMLILTGFGNIASAAVVPELDAASASSAIALVVGAALLAHDKFRNR